MLVPRKSRYALRAVFELAKRSGQGPVNVAEIAGAQAIPPRFLEVILNQLKQAGLVASHRGKQGGYYLPHAPSQVTVGDVMRATQGPVEPVDCAADGEDCPFLGECVFLPMWERVRKAMSDVYDHTTLQDLVDQERQRAEKYVASYAI
jgi:Rrf2 family protein